jgi:hypothetical protein
MFNSEEIRVITGIKGDLVLISAFSFLLDSIGYCGLYVFVVDENHQETVFKTSFEVTITTVKYTVYAWFEKK